MKKKYKIGVGLLAVAVLVIGIAADTGNALFWLQKVKFRGTSLRNLLDREFDTAVNVKDFGAVGTGLVSDQDAFDAATVYAVAHKKSIYIPAGEFKIKSWNTDNVPHIYGEGAIGIKASNLIHDPLATNGIVLSTGGDRPTIENVCLQGRKESNLRNPYTVVSASTRTNFVLNGTASQSVTNHNCYFYSALDNGAYRFLGTGKVLTVVGTAITLYPGFDKYASDATDLLGVGYKVCFGTNVTEFTVSDFDESVAGYPGINITGFGGNITLVNVRIEGFHVAIRKGVAIACVADNLLLGRNTIGIYCMTSSGSDDIFKNVYINGYYSSEPSALTESLNYTNRAAYRAARYGMRLSGSQISVPNLQVFGCINSVVCNFLKGGHFGNLYSDRTVEDDIVLENESEITIDFLGANIIGTATNNTYSIIKNTDSVISVAQVSSSAQNQITALNLSLNASTIFRTKTTIGTIANEQGFLNFDSPVGSASVMDPNDASYSRSFRDVSLPITNSLMSGMDILVSQGFERRGVRFSDTNATTISDTVLPVSVPWSVVFSGVWQNNWEGGGLTNLPAYYEISSTSPTITVGSITVTISRNASSGKLEGITTSGVAGKLAGFSGTIQIFVNNASLSKTSSMRLASTITAYGLGSFSTNSTMTVSATGATNSTGMNQIAWLTAATGLQVYDNAGVAMLSGVQTVAALTPILVQPNGSFTGTSITSAGSHAQ